MDYGKDSRGPQRDRYETPRNPFSDGCAVEVRGNQPGDMEKAMRILKKKLAREGFFRDMRKNEHYEKPSVRKRKKSAEARKRAKKIDRKVRE